MSEPMIMLDGPIPAFYRIDTTAHGPDCGSCAAAARQAAVYSRTSGSTGASGEQRDGDGLVHFGTVTRLS